MGVIWHTQVLLMLGGHVVAVYLAHVVALRVFPSHRQGVVSQLPMLALMVAYTCLGLWVLSLPLASHSYCPLARAMFRDKQTRSAPTIARHEIRASAASRLARIAGDVRSLGACPDVLRRIW